MKLSVLLVDDENIKLTTLGDALRNAGYEVTTSNHGSEADMIISKQYFDLALLDLKLPGVSGIELLRRIKERKPDTVVLMMTAYGTVETAVEAMRLGAYDYLTKPFYNDELLLKLRKVQKIIKLEKENERLQQIVEQEMAASGFIGQSTAMKQVLKLIETVAPTDTTVLICGESGAGKEVVATTIHRQSHLHDKPFIRFSCAALPPSLMESELFGYEKGAFTGAGSRKAGRFELADGGTIFLDDIDDLDISLQVKLLRVLQEREFERIGGTRTIRVNVRILAATKVDLAQKVKENKFRGDLYYRLNIFPITIPPLTQHPEDIPLLVQHFLKKLETRTQKQNMQISPTALKALMSYSWPGNTRELENVIERAMLLCSTNIIQPEHIVTGNYPKSRLEPKVRDLSSLDTYSLRETVRRTEKELIAKVLEITDGNKSQAAKLLEIPRTTLNDYIHRLELE